MTSPAEEAALAAREHLRKLSQKISDDEREA
jgi:hypothetical protein